MLLLLTDKGSYNLKNAVKIDVFFGRYGGECRCTLAIDTCNITIGVFEDKSDARLFCREVETELNFFLFEYIERGLSRVIRLNEILRSALEFVMKEATK